MDPIWPEARAQPERMINLYEYTMLYYVEEIMSNHHEISSPLIGDPSTWDHPTSMRQIPIEENINRLDLQTFIQAWFVPVISTATESQLQQAGRQICPIGSQRFHCILDSKYQISLEKIASINIKGNRGYRLSVKEMYFKLFQTANEPQQTKKFELVHKSECLVQSLRYLLRLFYEYFFHLHRKSNLSDLHHRRYQRALELFTKISQTLVQKSQASLQIILNLMKSKREENSNQLIPSLSAGEGFYDEDLESFLGLEDLISNFVSDEIESTELNIPSLNNEEDSANASNTEDSTPMSKRGRSDSESDFIVNTARWSHHHTASSSIPPSSSFSISGGNISMDINNTLSLIQQCHPHRLQDLSRLERNQLLKVLYPQLYQLLRSQDSRIFDQYCLPLLKVVLAYRLPSSSSSSLSSSSHKFYLHYFLPVDLVDTVDRLLNPILPNMAAEDEDDVYQCLIRDPTFFYWLKSSYPQWVIEGHELILKTFSRFYSSSSPWIELLNPSVVMNSSLADYVPYLAKHLLHHLWQLNHFEGVKGLLKDIRWLSAVVEWVGMEPLIEQITTFTHEVLIDSSIDVPFSGELLRDYSCGAPTVTTLTTLRTFLRRIPPSFIPSRHNFYQFLAMFLQTDVTISQNNNLPLFTLSDDLTAISQQCRQLLLHPPSSPVQRAGTSAFTSSSQQPLFQFYPLYVSKNPFLDQHSQGWREEKVICWRQALHSVVILQTLISSPHPHGYWMTLLSHNNEIKRVSGPLSDGNIEVSLFALLDLTFLRW
jgi:hypothetical protein